MARTKQEIARNSDELLDDVKQLRALEEEKRREPISSPGFHVIAEEITARSREIMKTALRQEELGNSAERGEETIEDVDRKNGNGNDRDGNDLARR